ncbi:MAG: hypothetical protein OXH29_12205 [bacterium]|nr:hypothetical protein [bacterium]
MSGMGEAMTVAASTKSLFRRGLSKRISSAATFLGKAIRQTARDRDITLERFSHHIARELRFLNCTLAAIAISDDHEEARSYLERVVERGIAVYNKRMRREDQFDEFDREFSYALDG